MAIGIYRAFKRKGEASSTKPVVFATNIQIWLSVFAFSVFIATTLGAIIGWLCTLKGVHPMLIGFALTIIGLVFMCFIIVVALSLFHLFNMFRQGWRGVPYKFDPDTEPDNVLMAISPLNKETNPSEYKKVLNRLIKEKDKLIKERADLITEYSDCIQDMEKRNDKSKTT